MRILCVPPRRLDRDLKETTAKDVICSHYKHNCRSFSITKPVIILRIPSVAGCPVLQMRFDIIPKSFFQCFKQELSLFVSRYQSWVIKAELTNPNLFFFFSFSLLLFLFFFSFSLLLFLFFFSFSLLLFQLLLAYKLHSFC